MNEPVPPSVRPPDPNTSLAHCIDLYLALTAGARSASTRGAKVSDLRMFSEFFQKRHQFLNISLWSQADTRKFLEQCAQKSKPATVNRRLATLKHFAGFCRRIEALSTDPTVGVVELPCEALAPTTLTQAQMEALYKAADRLVKTRTHEHALPVRDRAILLVLSQVGMRATSLCALDVNQFDGSCLRSVVGKGQGQRQDHHLSPRTREAVQAWVSQRGSDPGPLFWSFKKNPMARSDVSAALDLIAEAANRALPKSDWIKVSPSILRHTVAEFLCNQRGQEFAMMKLGHTSNRYIRRYVMKTGEVEEQRKAQEAEVEKAAEVLYNTWKDQPGWKPWVVGGNSLKQDEARRQAAKETE